MQGLKIGIPMFLSILPRPEIDVHPIILKVNNYVNFYLLYFTVNAFFHIFPHSCISSARINETYTEFRVANSFIFFLANWFASKVSRKKQLTQRRQFVYRTGAEEVSLVEPAYRTDLSRPAIASRDFTPALGTIIQFYVKYFFFNYY